MGARSTTVFEHWPNHEHSGEPAYQRLFGNKKLGKDCHSLLKRGLLNEQKRAPEITLPPFP